MSPTSESAGTAEREWTTCAALRELPPLALADCSSALVVAPHPDDEVLGVGGTLAELAERGAGLATLALTDGEASHPGASIRREDLAMRRVAETRAALRELAPECPIARLGLPDGGLAACEAAIEEAVARRLSPGVWCFAPFRRDGHPDHEAAFRACARACRTRGARLLEFPIWLWHWTRPGDDVIPWDRSACVPLSIAARVRKASAVSMFASQIAPISDEPGGEAILPSEVLEHFQRPYEVLFT